MAARVPTRLQPIPDSFPSGHATIAFGAAAALDRETAAGWVSWVAYPTAGLVGWSRLRDNQHWMSDVVAGALIGYWTANKAEDWLRARSERTGPAVGVVVAPDGTGPMLGARLSF